MDPQKTAPPPPDAEAPRQTIIMGHHYDGIREYDNPMPGWWLWLFWIPIILAPVYVLGVHTFGFINTYEDDLAEGQADLQRIRDTYAAANPASVIDADTLAAYVQNPGQVAAGATLFVQYCAACHGEAGQGGIGPNLTDNYWLHGGTDLDVFNVITNGVIEKGMTPWESVLSAEERAQVAAFVRSIHGTDPPNAKAPQGELFEP